MATNIPAPPARNEDPWFDKRDAFDQAVRTRLNTELSDAALSATIDERADERGMNVLKNGVAGDGVADDTAALHSIRDSAAAFNVPVYVPAGTYRVTGLVLNKAGQLWRLESGAVISAADNIPGNLILISGAGSHLLGGEVDGRKASQTADRNGVVISAAGVTVQDMNVHDCRGNGIALAAAAVGCLVTGNYSHHNGVDSNASAGIQVVDGCDNRIVANRCEYNGTHGNATLYDGDGIRIQGTSAARNVVANNTCRFNARRGIKSQQGTSSITGNVCSNNSDSGIGVTNSANPQNTPQVIAGNTLTGNLFGLHLDNCQNIAISGNLISDSIEYGVLANTISNAVSFTGNNVVRSGRHGVLVQGGEDWTLVGNQILDSGQAGVNRYGAVFETQGTTVCKRILLSGNTSHNSGVSTSQTHGFVISGSADQITVVGNAAVNGVTTDYSLSGTMTNLTFQGNAGRTASNQSAPWTSFYMAAGSFIGSNTGTGFRIATDPTHKLGFWGRTPVVQPSGTPAAATDAATAQTLVNFLRSALIATGLIGAS